MDGDADIDRLSSLQSKDHGQLLDVIDLLRSQGINHYVSLPQLIVCGDQSSGKSSVLEAVSRIPFPTKDSLCTRFATELILRRGPTPNVIVTIIPGKERSDEERRTLVGFQPPTVHIKELHSLIDEANKVMGLGSTTRAFTDDVLRVEASGPEQPHLTLVDLPGLIHAENNKQSASDVELVSSLVQSYMANARSIILAVVSAKNDYANQIVTRLARNVDPNGKRTLGIITKPDTLHVGSESENDFLHLAMNKDVMFRLGWHTLRNRDYSHRDCSTEERDEIERDFFSRGVWTRLSARNLGIAALKPRLSRVLEDQIISELPSLIHDVKSGIQDCRARLSRLGEARATPEERRRYLVHISQSFGSLISATVNGVYMHEFFGDARTDIGYNKRVRAVVQNLLLQFADDIRREGHEQQIVEGECQKDSHSIPERISRSDYMEDVRELMRRSRGSELPGTFNPLIVGDLFYRQARPWKRLVEQFKGRILGATRTAVELILIYVTDETTREGLLREIINPAFERFTQQLDGKVAEIIRPHQTGHPITYNHYFTETIQKARQEHAKNDQIRRLNAFFKLRPELGLSYVHSHQGFNTGDLLNALNPPVEHDMDRFACSEATYCMQAYYQIKVAMKVLVDNFAVLAIENRLLDSLLETLSPDTVMKLNDRVISDIAAESEDSLTERAGVTKKLEALDAGLQTLNRLGQHGSAVYHFADRPDPQEKRPSVPKLNKAIGD
ncbi:MAG: hypothetical protein Q9201_000613 [Fulgogasparrea decipioides]